MELLDTLRIGTVYTVGLYSEDGFDGDNMITQVVLYNRQSKKTFPATTGMPLVIDPGATAEVTWDADVTKQMAVGMYSIQAYTGKNENFTCVLDEECVRANVVSASNKQ